ncbi:MAG: ribonuclease HII [Nitrospiraceae bacterium]|nr:ribonuclease HII [Nitrospiraceae bacterium]
MDLYRHDSNWRHKGFRVIAGIDEAGRGPIAGPVVAAAVVLPDDLRIKGLRDSKQVPEKERTTLFREILVGACAIGVGVSDHREIDALNILRATRRAMERAVEDLSVRPDMLIIDAVALPSVDIRQISPYKGESISSSVAAASIVAKYVRDVMMNDFHELYPQYDFRKHKGYCTQDHMAMLQAYGPCPIHRKSFRKVMELELPF